MASGVIRVGAVAMFVAGMVGSMLPAACGDDKSDLFGSGGADASSAGTGAQGGSNGGSTASGGSGGSGGARPCSSDADCSGLKCDPIKKRCVACVFDGDCAAGEHCDVGACLPVAACNNTLDCAGDPYGRLFCDVDGGACVVCLSYADCPDHNDCTDNHCVPYDACSSSPDCPSGQVCDVALSRCVQCRIDEDCPAGERCSANTCRPSCASDASCEALGYVCDVTRGFCVRCLSVIDCPAGYACAEDECVIGSGGSGGAGGGGGSGGTGGSAPCARDVVIALDTSANLADDQAYILPQMQALSPRAAASAVDLRIILLSAKSNSTNGICMSAPLGSGSCPADDLPPRFVHPAVSISNTNALSQILSSYSQYRNMLRPAAQKAFVVITTGNSSITATQFDISLRQLDPMFTTYSFHGIYAFTAPSMQTCQSTGDVCCNTGIAVGTQYSTLADMTGGLKVNLCSHDFSAVWDRITTCP